MACTPCFAQVDAKGQWQFPVNVRTYCQNIEQNLVAIYKSMIETNRKWLDQDYQGDKRQLMQVSDANKQTIKEYEDSWHKMGCVDILYPKK